MKEIVSPRYDRGRFFRWAYLNDEDDDRILRIIDRRVRALEDTSLAWCSRFAHVGEREAAALTTRLDG